MSFTTGNSPSALSRARPRPSPTFPGSPPPPSASSPTPPWVRSKSPSPTARSLSSRSPPLPTSPPLIGPLTLRGPSLIDERSGAFQTLTLGQYRLVHSGDLKIYDNLALRPRAFVVPNAVVLPA